MKKLLFLFVFALIVSCKKDDSPLVHEPPVIGLLETFLATNPSVEINKFNNWIPNETAYWGYLFTPTKDIKLTHIGGRIAENGVFRIELYTMSPDHFSMSIKDTLLIDSITITDISKFQFKIIASGIILKADQRYEIRYLDKSSNSIWSAGRGNPNDVPGFNFPVKTGPVVLEASYSSKNYSKNGVWVPYFEQISGYGIQYGLPDFVYEPLN